MSAPQPEPSGLGQPRSIATYDSFEQARLVQAYLVRQGVPAPKLMIVGTDLHLAERRLGSAGWRNIILGGAMVGLVWGSGLALVLWWLLPEAPMARVIGGALGFGVAYGVIAGLVQYGMAHGERDIDGVLRPLAAHYAVEGEVEIAAQARALIAGMPALETGSRWSFGARAEDSPAPAQRGDWRDAASTAQGAPGVEPAEATPAPVELAGPEAPRSPAMDDTDGIGRVRPVGGLTRPARDWGPRPGPMVPDLPASLATMPSEPARVAPAAPAAAVPPLDRPPVEKPAVGVEPVAAKPPATPEPAPTKGWRLRKTPKTPKPDKTEPASPAAPRRRFEDTDSGETEMETTAARRYNLDL